MAMETVIPKLFEDRSKTCDSALVVPEITAVSNPNSRPPKAATTVLFNNTEFSFMRSPAGQLFFQGLWLQQSSNPELLHGGWRPALLHDSRSQQFREWATRCPSREGTRPRTHRLPRPYPQLG